MSIFICRNLSLLLCHLQIVLAEALGVKKITGKTLRKVLVGASGPAALMTLINLSGFGAYLMLTTVIHAIFTTMLGITLPFAVYQNATIALSFLTGPFGFLLMAGLGGIPLLLGNRNVKRMLHARTVWLGVRACNLPVTPEDDTLPSFADVRADQTHSELEALKGHIDRLNRELDNTKRIRAREERNRTRTESQLRNVLSKLTDTERKKAEVEKRGRELQNRLHRLKVEHGHYQNSSVTPEEIEKVRSELEVYKETADEMSTTIDHLKTQNRVLLENLETRDQQLSQSAETIDRLQKDREKEERIHEIKLEKSRQILERTWVHIFPRFRFESKALRFAAKCSRIERMDIERCLVELYSAQDPGHLSKGKMRSQNNVHHAPLRLGDQPGRIQYDLRNGLVYIIDIYYRRDQNKTDKQR